MHNHIAQRYATPNEGRHVPKVRDTCDPTVLSASNPQQKRTRGDSNPRPSAPEALALSMLCNETTMYKKSPLNVGFYIYAVDSDFAT